MPFLYQASYHACGFDFLLWSTKQKESLLSASYHIMHYYYIAALSTYMKYWLYTEV